MEVHQLAVDLAPVWASLLLFPPQRDLYADSMGVVGKPPAPKPSPKPPMVKAKPSIPAAGAARAVPPAPARPGAASTGGGTKVPGTNKVLGGGVAKPPGQLDLAAALAKRAGRQSVQD
jgi:hypothetical protein